VGAFRRRTLLPLDDCLYSLQPTIPHLTLDPAASCSTLGCMLAARAGGRGCSLGGEIERDANSASVRFGDDCVEYQVGVRLRRFRNGGLWAMAVCPRFGREAG
jgi:hypothetical protein